MADTKVSDLTALAQADVDTAADLLPIVDTGATATKSVTPAALVSKAVGALAPTALAGSEATSAVSVAQTWNTTGTPSAIKLNVTDTASNAASLLMDLQVGSASQFKVDKAGNVTALGDVNLGTTAAVDFGTTEILGGNNVIYISYGRSTKYAFSAGAFKLENTYVLGWTPTNNLANSADTILARDAANTLAQRNGANAQAFRIYGTYTAADNFQRLAITSASVTLSALSGASVTATGLIPAGAVVMGVTSRVSTLITGADGYQIGTAADADRWADKTGVAVGTTTDNRDWTAGTIENFAAATDVIVTAKTANFTAGAVVVTVHYLAGQAD